MIDVSVLSPEIQKEIYRPNEEEQMRVVTLHRTEDGNEPPEPDFELETTE